ncbi:MAG TPA: Crp/Fnr family transcriptional regulator [Rhodopila sp.]|nr:Crp/Fnr family transcriptional regulator [Rhodopila sp.]
MSLSRMHPDSELQPDDKKSADLHRGSLFLRSLPSSDLRRMESYLELGTFTREEVIQSDGGMIEHIIFPHDVTVSMLCMMAHGASVESATVGSEGYVGVECMLGSSVAICSAVGRQGKASTIALDRILILMDQMPALRAAMLTYAQNYLAMVSRLVACNAIHNLRQRACRRLLLALDQTEQQSVAMTQEELARALGVGRTSVNQACKELREDGLIEYSRGRIQISNVSGMTKAACDCYSYIKRAMLI